MVYASLNVRKTRTTTIKMTTQDKHIIIHRLRHLRQMIKKGLKSGFYYKELGKRGVYRARKQLHDIETTLKRLLDEL